MLARITVFLMIFPCSAWEAPSCVLSCTHQESVSSAGDFTIGGLVQRYLNNVQVVNNFTERKEPWHCFQFHSGYFIHHMAFLYAIEQINRDPEILPNLTLGYRMLDPCSSSLKALQGTLSILSEQREPVPNYSCQNRRSLAGFVGDHSSAKSYSIAQILGLYKHPQVSYGALDPVFSDKMRFPSFYRTVPNERSYFAGITQLLEYFGWTWVGIMVTDDSSGERASKDLRSVVAQSGGCVEFLLILPTEKELSSYTKMIQVVFTFLKSTGRVVILYNSGSSIDYMFQFFKLFANLPHKIWILSPGMYLPAGHGMNLLNGSLSFSLQNREINGFQDFLSDIRPSVLKDDLIFALLWKKLYHCKLAESKYEVSDEAKLPLCSFNKTLGRSHASRFQLSHARLTYSVYTAVYALAHALHDMVLSNNSKGFPGGQKLEPWKVSSSGKTWVFEDQSCLPEVLVTSLAQEIGHSESRLGP